ncbi:N-lysine methyltransferase SETD6-like [Corticium candelabrum]|uniref:N-lysine methyltransferase SETD6-like n=1 Tax=Corticium candelabrum TaxID=121492 RepID=UPI002E264E64|nr:N-lysine methyltransferase SETD6-like [Corticium candelabrum]
MEGTSKLQRFLQWCSASGIIINDSVDITNSGSCAQYGMVARRTIRKGEKLATIPKTAILSVACEAVNPVARYLVSTGLLPSSNPKKVTKSGESEEENVWIPLLVTLMGEYCKHESYWRPYFDLCPQFDEMDPVLLWESSETARLLRGTGLVERVEHETDLIERDYLDTVEPLITAREDLFDCSTLSLTLYKKMVSFVMAYSFTDPVCRNVYASVMMVPVADILNHHSKHNAKIVYGRTALDIVALRAIKPNEEVFNTYGRLGNAELLYKYGFSEHCPNLNDHATVRIEIVRGVANIMSKFKGGRFQKQWELVCNFLDMNEDDDRFCVAFDGEPEDNLLAIVHTICLSKKAWKMSNIAVLSSVDELSDEARQLLKEVCLKCLGQYDCSLQDDVDLINNKEEQCSRRERFALYVRLGQKQALHNLIDACEAVK